MAVLAAALPQSVPAFTLDRKCGSGLTAMALAARSIIAGDIYVALSGGMGSISLTVTKDAPRFVNQSVLANQPHAYMAMIETAEIVAERYGISRAAQDAYAAQSQQRAVAGLARGAFAEEIAPITVEKAIFDREGNRTGSETVTVTQDEGIRPGTTAEALAGLKVHDIGLWEFNEAFASQCLYCRDTLGIDPERYNVNGGAIAIGHPFSA